MGNIIKSQQIAYYYLLWRDGGSMGPMDFSLRGGFYGYQQQTTSVVREDEDEGEDLNGIIHNLLPHFFGMQNLSLNS